MVQVPSHDGGEAVRLGVNPPGAAGEGAPESCDGPVPSPFPHLLQELSPEPTKGLLLSGCKKRRVSACVRGKRAGGYMYYFATSKHRRVRFRGQTARAAMGS